MATVQGVQLRNPIGGLRDGFLALIPVYRRGAELNSLDERRCNTLAMVDGVFRTVFGSILDHVTLPQNVDVYLYPAQSGPEAMPVYWRGAANREHALKAESQKALADVQPWTTVLKAGDAKWNLVIVPVRGGLISYYRAWLVLAAVLLVSAHCLSICGPRCAKLFASRRPIAGSSSWHRPISYVPSSSGSPM